MSECHLHAELRGTGTGEDCGEESVGYLQIQRAVDALTMTFCALIAFRKCFLSLRCDGKAADRLLGQ